MLVPSAALPTVRALPHKEATLNLLAFSLKTASLASHDIYHVTNTMFE